MRLFTLGHGTATQEALAGRIRSASLERLVDVRTVPKSRRFAHVWSERLALWVPQETGALYAWEPALGGFRRTHPGSQNTALRHPAFRGYADYMQTGEFQSALAALLKHAAGARTAVLCSETLWWRCHRRLIADAATLLHGVEVLHVLPGGKMQVHVPTAGVRIVGEALRYDGA